jgi:hypothetical protein
VSDAARRAVSARAASASRTTKSTPPARTGRAAASLARPRRPMHAHQLRRRRLRQRIRGRAAGRTSSALLADVAAACGSWYGQSLHWPQLSRHGRRWARNLEEVGNGWRGDGMEGNLATPDSLVLKSIALCLTVVSMRRCLFSCIFWPRRWLMESIISV